MSDGETDGTAARAAFASELDLLVPDVAGGPLEATAFLLGLSGRHAGVLFRIRAGETVLGRSSRSVVSFDEKAVSQRHAHIVSVGGRTVITDLGSTNGTFVNDARISGPVELRAGDVVRIGKTSLGFLTDATDEQQHTRALAHTSSGRVPFNHSRAVVPYTGVAGGAALTTTGTEASGLDVALDRVALIWGIVRRYGRWLLVGIAFGAAAGALTVTVRPPKAIAECRIFLNQQGKEEQQHTRYAAQGAEYFRFAIENFTSPELVKETLVKLGQPASPGDVMGAVGSLVFVPEFEGMYQGTFYHTDPDFAERFLAEHLHNYLEREIQKSIRVLSQEVELLKKQYAENELHLQKTEAELREFKEKHLAGLPEHATTQLQSRAALEERALALRANLERYNQELALAQKEYASGDVLMSERFGRVAPHEAAIAGVRQKIAALRARGLTEEHPEVRQLRSEERNLDALRTRSIAEEASTDEKRANRELGALGSRVGQLQVSVNSTRTELGLVEGRLAELEGIASTMPAVEERFSELSRSLSTSQSLHQHLHEQLKAKELKLEFERASVAGRYDLVAPPSATRVSIAKTAAQRGGIGAAAGLGLAAVVAGLNWLFAYARDRRKVRGVSVG